MHNKRTSACREGDKSRGKKDEPKSDTSEENVERQPRNAENRRRLPMLSEENTAMHFHFGVSTGSNFQGEVQDQIDTLRDERISGSEQKAWPHVRPSGFQLIFAVLERAAG